MIDPEIYAGLLNMPSQREIEDILRKLPNDKATRPSGVSYKMLHKLDGKSVKTLCLLFRIVLVTASHCPSGNTIEYI